MVDSKILKDKILEIEIKYIFLLLFILMFFATWGGGEAIFGLIATLFGLNTGLLDNYSYSILTGILVLSAVLPTIIAQKWFVPRHLEDLN